MLMYKTTKPNLGKTNIFRNMYGLIMQNNLPSCLHFPNVITKNVLLPIGKQ